MSPIKVGEIAPDFKVMDNYEKNIRLTDYRGKRVLLSWHPLAWTPVCTDQMRALENHWQEFEKLNTVPLGFSVDPAPCKKEWAIALAITHLKLPSDFWPHGAVARSYGIFNEQDGISERANIIIDASGKIQWVKVYPPAQLPDIHEVISILSNG
jgi:peroxiredoxin